MSAGPFLDQRSARSVLEDLLVSGRVPPALLFTGPHGVGREEAALALAAGLNCTGGEAADLFTAPSDGAVPGAPRLGGCRTCAACRRIYTYTHPDVLVRLPLPRPKGKKNEPADPSDALTWKAAHPYRDPDIPGGNLSIGVHDVRVLVSQLGYAPVEGHRRVIIFREADAMGEEGQNALLKSLEEPPEHTRFILTAERLDALLPTVLSRSRVVRFGTLPVQVMADWMKEAGGIDPAVADRAAALARGSLKRALRIAEEGVPGREEALQFLEWTLGGRALEALGWASGYSFKSGGGAWTEARHVLEELASLTRDVAALAAGEDAPLHNPDQRDRLLEMAASTTPEAAVKMLEAVQEARGEVDRFGNLALIYATLTESLSAQVSEELIP